MSLFSRILGIFGYVTPKNIVSLESRVETLEYQQLEAEQNNQKVYKLMRKMHSRYGMEEMREKKATQQDNVENSLVAFLQKANPDQIISDFQNDPKAAIISLAKDNPELVQAVLPVILPKVKELIHGD